jgi:predicted MFS family arabinose efflux permease
MVVRVVGELVTIFAGVPSNVGTWPEPAGFFKGSKNVVAQVMVAGVSPAPALKLSSNVTATNCGTSTGAYRGGCCDQARLSVYGEIAACSVASSSGELAEAQATKRGSKPKARSRPDTHRV